MAERQYFYRCDVRVLFWVFYLFIFFRGLFWDVYGACSVAVQYPKLPAYIKDGLTDVRDAGLPINNVIARAVMVEMIRKMVPEMLLKNCERFTCSR